MMVSNASLIMYSGIPEIELDLNRSLDSPNSTSTYNRTRDETAQQDPMIALTVPAIMFASGVFGNILAIFVLLRSSKEHKQTVFYRLVGALAVTDLFGTCATSPITLAVYANKLKWVGGDALCEYEGFMLIFAGFATIFIIGAMAVDRYLAIKHPFFYNQHISFDKAKYLIIILWIIAVIISSLPLIGLGDNVKQFPGTWCFFTFTSREIKNQIFAYFYASLGLLVIGVTAVSNAFVTFGLLKMRRKAKRNLLSATSTKRHDSELQMMVLLLGIVIIFSACWSPFMIRIIINQINFKQMNVKADLYALRLASLNQILDPWIYILFRKELFMRVFTFFKDYLSIVCGCIYFRSLFRRSDNNNIHNSSQYNKAAEFCENGQLIHRVDAQNVDERKSTDSCKAVDMETFPLKPDTHHSQETLNLKHSACLFCLGNHPKRVVLTSLSESRSVGELKHICDQSSAKTEIKTAEHLKVSEYERLNSAEDTELNESIVFGKTSTTLSFPQPNIRRRSIHLSLENIIRDGCCPCPHH